MTADGPGPALLHASFRRGLERDGEAEALRVGTASLTYRQLHDRALGIAGGLLAGRPQPPRRVGVLGSRSPDAYAGLLAALYVGAAVVPLNPAFPPERLRAVIRAAALDGLVVDDRGLRLLPTLADAWGGTPGDPRPVHGGAPGAPPLRHPLPSSPEDTA